jgi:A/G-specific adenine glycosylase
MPWKGEKDPYKIWLSEVILQQTRVEQGSKYYENFVHTFPDIYALANASDQKIYKLWEGLGYYRRCQNLIATARYVATDLHGKFPHQYEELRKLRGIGPYTAAAIASFAFNEPRAVVDGNVYRVLSRIFAIDKPVDSTEGKKYFNQLANQLIDEKKPGLFNQAIMDFGAVICKPIPQCRQCPFNKFCKAFLNDRTSLYPLKTKKPNIKKRWFNYILLEYNESVAVRQRKERDVWHNLFEFLLVESSFELNKNGILRELKRKGWLNKNTFEVKSVSQIFRQQLTHQRIEGKFTALKLRHKPALADNVLWIKKSEIKDYPFPKFINQYLEQREVSPY